jgi:hypothetical protein
MQLDTVNIKIAETEDNKRNYELNISNLKEEELENLMKLDALRRAITENLNLYRKMNALKVNALHDRAEAESEKDMFASEVWGFCSTRQQSWNNHSTPFVFGGKSKSMYLQFNRGKITAHRLFSAENPKACVLH